MYLTRKHFMSMLGLAFVLHLLFGIIWWLSPGLKVNKIPVHVLNIKLGSGDMLAQPSASRVMQADVATAQATRLQLEDVPPPREHQRVQAEVVPTKQPSTQELVAKAQERSRAMQAAKQRGTDQSARHQARQAAQTTNVNRQQAEASQFVRQYGAAGGVGVGSAIGNSTESTAEMVERYTQMISMWIQRYKVYPKNLSDRGIQGKAIVRIRIDRKGNILRFRLDQSTGHAELDEAVARMVQAANPVPAVPANYPTGNVIEFLIPVSYKVP